MSHKRKTTLDEGWSWRRRMGGTAERSVAKPVLCLSGCLCRHFLVIQLPDNVSESISLNNPAVQTVEQIFRTNCQ